MFAGVDRFVRKGVYVFVVYESLSERLQEVRLVGNLTPLWLCFAGPGAAGGGGVGAASGVFRDDGRGEFLRGAKAEGALGPHLAGKKTTPHATLSHLFSVACRLVTWHRRARRWFSDT
eukprot:181351-Prorocentrum_minimum.AAC.1